MKRSRTSTGRNIEADKIPLIQEVLGRLLKIAGFSSLEDGKSRIQASQLERNLKYNALQVLFCVKTFRKLAGVNKGTFMQKDDWTSLMLSIFQEARAVRGLPCPNIVLKRLDAGVCKLDVFVLRPHS